MSAMDVSVLLQIISDSQMAARSAAGALSLVIFDILLTLDAERVCIWRAPMSLTKGCYFTGRYLGLLNLTVYASDATDTVIFETLTLSYHDSCAPWRWYYYLVIVLSSMASCNVLLALRLDNLFRNTRYFRLLPIAETVLLCLFSAFSSVALKPKLQPWRGCIYTVHPASSLSFILTLPELGLTCIYFSLALYKFLKHVRERSNMIGHRAIRDSGNITSTLSLILRDGVVFYAIKYSHLATIFVTGALSWTAGLLAYGGTPWIVACYSVAGSRLVLMLQGNPREAMGIYQQQGTELWVTPLNRGDDETMYSDTAS
ncbi:hypothetical protein JB92DRAFT_3020831 [Gautieria morchelliformis]|nr:hypothetical protein JB92DRAFT_3020831 [Gautieria morchelliformis]